MHTHAHIHTHTYISTLTTTATKMAVGPTPPLSGQTYPHSVLVHARCFFVPPVALPINEKKRNLGPQNGGKEKPPTLTSACASHVSIPTLSYA